MRAANIFLSTIFVASLLLVAGVARADVPDGKNALTGSLSVVPGGVALGVDFENGYNHTYGIGGYFHLAPNDKGVQHGVTTVGVFVRPHFSRQAWDLYLTPGFGILLINPENNDSNQTLIGPSLGLGVLYELSPKMAVGMDHTTYSGWIGGADIYRGAQYEDLTARFRWIF